ncbi:MAG: hypothetical protein K5752_02220 [Succinivibrionaceae bacterium]|nr:hypothetical protein [Succinivibrionaceae bacterium]
MITLEYLSQSPFSFDLAELNDKTLQRKIYDYKKCIADKFKAWKSSSKQQLVFNKYLAECEDQIVKAVNSSGYSELFIKLLLEMFIHLNNEDSAISPVIIKDLETCFFGDYVYYFGEHSLHIFDSKIEHDEVHAAKLFELFEAMFENEEFLNSELEKQIEADYIRYFNDFSNYNESKNHHTLAEVKSDSYVWDADLVETERADFDPGDKDEQQARDELLAKFAELNGLMPWELLPLKAKYRNMPFAMWDYKPLFSVNGYNPGYLGDYEDYYETDQLFNGYGMGDSNLDCIHEFCTYEMPKPRDEYKAKLLQALMMARSDMLRSSFLRNFTLSSSVSTEEFNHFMEDPAIKQKIESCDVAKFKTVSVDPDNQEEIANYYRGCNNDYELYFKYLEQPENSSRRNDFIISVFSRDLVNMMDDSYECSEPYAQQKYGSILTEEQRNAFYRYWQNELIELQERSIHYQDNSMLYDLNPINFTGDAYALNQAYILHESYPDEMSARNVRVLEKILDLSNNYHCPEI